MTQAHDATQDDGSLPDDERTALVEQIVRHEWNMFQRTTNEGGRAACQGNWPMFALMRTSQFMPWPIELIRSYLQDLVDAKHRGRNLVEEKYARMMASTDPERYRRDIAPYIPALDDARVARQERIVACQLDWARDFTTRFPHIGANMRVLTSDQDTGEQTSYETYLRGELGTYSPRTLGLYEDFVMRLQAQGGNLTQLTVAWTMRLAGSGSLDEAEQVQGGSPRDRQGGRHADTDAI